MSNLSKYIVLLLLFGYTHLHAKAQKPEELNKDTLSVKIRPFFSQDIAKVQIDSIQFRGDTLSVWLSDNVVYFPWRVDRIKALKSLIKDVLNMKQKPVINLRIGNAELESLIPNYFRTPQTIDELRKGDKQKPAGFIKNCNKPEFQSGLTNHNIALWNSHGYYFEPSFSRWEWQRARCFGSVEDASVFSYVMPYLVPMLENAGAYVMLPRERDIQKHEVIVDNDFSTNKSMMLFDNKKLWNMKAGTGFKWSVDLKDGENPFTKGTSMSRPLKKHETAELIYLPRIPKSGEYAVYVSWGKSDKPMTKVVYRVNHATGTSRFIVNQSMGAGTFHYLGTFQFNNGADKQRGSVALLKEKGEEGVLSADAVRFGGGMGNVLRRASNDYEKNKQSAKDDKPIVESNNPLGLEYQYQKSGVARYLEAARYYLQYNGMPVDVYSPTAYKNDYNDDYQSRGGWVNYLNGQYIGKDGKKEGLNIPIDAVLAFHTDAGITKNDSIIGTLAIYSTRNDKFTNGVSKAASRDLSDLIQTQIVNDLKMQCNPKWTRRAMWDKPYSEAWRPEVPTMLLELLSHQNLADMTYGLDPRFRFITSRAIYKGMLRFITGQYNRPYVVQPLPPDHFGIERIEGKKIKISWQPVVDSLETTAVPKYYYVRLNPGNLGNEQVFKTEENSFELELPKYGQDYQFRVTALNDGGESFPTEELSVCLFKDKEKPVLIVNGFDRISGPRFFDDGKRAGIEWWIDEGVPDVRDVSFMGYQYDFMRSSAWLDDDSPGWGASDVEGWSKVIAGNTHNYPAIHGNSFKHLKISYVSADRKCFESGRYDPLNYSMIDLILGKQRTIKNFKTDSIGVFKVFTPAMMRELTRFSELVCPIMLTGAYLGTDMMENKDTIAIKFAKDVLGYQGRSIRASKNGEFYPTDEGKYFGFNLWGKFNTDLNEDFYKVESPDAIEPFGKKSFRIYRYVENNLSAGVVNDGTSKTFVLGFPFESILSLDFRNNLMKDIIEFLKIKK